MVSCFGLFGVNSEFNDLKDHRLYVFSYGTVKPFHFGVPHFGMGPYGDQKAHRVQDSPIHRFTAQELMVRCFRIWQSERLEQQTVGLSEGPGRPGVPSNHTLPTLPTCLCLKMRTAPMRMGRMGVMNRKKMMRMMRMMTTGLGAPLKGQSLGGIHIETYRNHWFVT